MTGEAWLLVAVAAVAGYLLAKGGCGCASHATAQIAPDGPTVEFVPGAPGMLDGHYVVRGIG